ncbi:GDSL-type esterase/lipase family protein [uncultured Clostridium sp.]|uniref:GDSL-type esterase/lipase family protein n=1 Tax=uncultured Clostridium sp. TaxID=59620 RepID=UPI0026003D38|nr:GDSL-type esterase/lipase family protein [uncultured Clostridium sp.]
MSYNIDIIFLGDSLTYGYGVPKEKSWVYLTAKRLNLNYLNKSQNGDTTPSMLSRYYSNVIKYNPSRIFIMGGTNDLLCGRKVLSISDNIEIMIKDGLKINAEIILGIPPKIIGSMANELFIPSSFYKYTEENLLNLKEQLICLSKKYKIKIINFYDIDFTNFYLDGIHISTEGNNIMYNEAVKILK